MKVSNPPSRFPCQPSLPTPVSLSLPLKLTFASLVKTLFNVLKTVFHGAD